jgi:hypothetical protein
MLRRSGWTSIFASPAADHCRDDAFLLPKENTRSQGCGGGAGTGQNQEWPARQVKRVRVFHESAGKGLLCTNVTGRL